MSIQTPNWVQDAVFYQIFPDRFRRSGRVAAAQQFESWDSPPTVYGFKGGDLLGVVEKLDYLSELGITAIYLNPIFASAANHRYHTYDYFHVDPLLGGNQALRELLDAAHARDMRVVLDGVFNHASRGFWQFHHVLENGTDSPYVDWFHFDPQRLERARHFAAYPDPHAQASLEAGCDSFEAIGYGAWWNLPALPKFNTATPAVREFLLSVATHWVQFGIDGWRLDVPEEIDDDDFWREFRRCVRSVNPEAYLVGEIWHAAPRWLQGDQFDAVMNYPITAACLGFFSGDGLDLELARQPAGLHNVHTLSAEHFASQIDHCLGLYPPEITAVQFNLLDSHDMPRFLSCARGDKSALRMALLFLMTIPGTPCLYYGDEIGLAGRQDPDCRRAFPWDPSQWDDELLGFTRRCLRLRNAHPALRRGSFTRLAAGAGMYAFARRHEQDFVLVAWNTNLESRQLELPSESVPPQVAQLRDAWNGQTVAVREAGAFRLEIPPRSGLAMTPGG